MIRRDTWTWETQLKTAIIIQESNHVIYLNKLSLLLSAYTFKQEHEFKAVKIPTQSFMQATGKLKLSYTYDFANVTGKYFQKKKTKSFLSVKMVLSCSFLLLGPSLWLIFLKQLIATFHF